MADFQIISDVSNTILKLLRENMCPDPIQTAEAIALAAPTDKNGNFQLGIYLYDFREITEYRSTSPINLEDNKRRRASKILSLNYIIFINSKAQIAAGAEMEQRILGRALQIIADSAKLDISITNEYLDDAEKIINLAMLNQAFDERTKIWSAIQSPYQLAVYFEASPLVLESKVEQKVVRVTRTDISAEIINK